MINIDVKIITRVDMVAVLIADTLIGFVTGIGVDVLADMMTGLEFVLPSLSEESELFC